MIRFLVQRLVVGVAVFLSVTSLAYLLFNARGASAIVFNILGPDATAEDIERKAEALGLNRPLVVQYGEWIGGLLRGDLGQSFLNSQQVTSILASRIPVTLSLILFSLVLMGVLSVFLGVVSATRGGVVDRLVQGASVVAGAVPGYWLALILVIVFGLNLRLFPATGFIPITTSFTGWLSTIVLPSVAIALGGIFGLAVWIRSSIIDLRRREWVRTLRARGIPSRTIMYRHVLRNAAAPTVQAVALQVIGLLGGTVIVERIFALPGLGTLALNSGQAGDIPVVLGTVVVFVLVIVLINLTVDVVNGLLNPKARIS